MTMMLLMSVYSGELSTADRYALRHHIVLHKHFRLANENWATRALSTYYCEVVVFLMEMLVVSLRTLSESLAHANYFVECRWLAWPVASAW